MEILLAVLINFILAPFVPLIFKTGKKIAPWIVSAVPLALFFLFSRLIPTIKAEISQTFSFQWIPVLEVQLSFYLDGLSLLFALLITCIGFFIFLYSKDYLKDEPGIGLFYAYLLLFMGSMLGLVLANNLIALYVFWEFTTISSFLLIGFHHEDKKSRRAAIQALLVTNAGGLALLAGFILIAQVTGSFELSEILLSENLIRDHPYYSVIFILLAFAAFTKSAQLPFHFWLTNAMEAPTPVSAYLHSATMVKGGIYLIARLHPVMGNTELWFYTLAIIGGLTLITGAYLGLIQPDIKKLLAYSTVSVLGMLMLMLAIGSENALKGAVIYLFAHALYKAALFLCAGAIDHETGTREITRIGGLGRFMPFIAVAGIMAAFSKSGLPPAIGLIGKELIYKSGLHVPEIKTLVILALVIGNMFLVAVAWLAGIKPFFGKVAPKPPHRPSFALWISPLFLALGGFTFGIFPKTIEKSVIEPAVSAISEFPPFMDMALWHGFKPEVLLSILTIAGGLILFFTRHGFRKLREKAGAIARFGPDHLYDLTLEGTRKTASAITGVIQNGYQRRYLITILIFTAFLVAYRLMQFGDIDIPVGKPDLTGLFALFLSVLIVFATFVVIFLSSMITAVISLGVVGFSIAIIFMLYSAPDLALTQILIETITLILFVTIIYRLPNFKKISSTAARLRDAAIALAGGGIITLLILQANTIELQESISWYFIENSYPLAHGKNMVNVVLTDFRNLDTLGEITVLAIAALGVFTLMKLKSKDV